MSEPKYRDRRGEPLTEMEHKVLSSLHSYTRVARDEIHGHTVETTWRGETNSCLNMFVTYVHIAEGPHRWSGYGDLPRRHYDTESEAVAGHARAVALVTAIGEDISSIDVDRIHAALDGVPDEPFEVAKNRTERRGRL